MLPSRSRFLAEATSNLYYTILKSYYTFITYDGWKSNEQLAKSNEQGAKTNEQ